MTYTYAIGVKATYTDIATKLPKEYLFIIDASCNDIRIIETRHDFERFIGKKIGRVSQYGELIEVQTKIITLEGEYDKDQVQAMLDANKDIWYMNNKKR